MTHVLIATDLLPIIGFGVFLVFVIFVLGRAAASGQLNIHRPRRSFWHRDTSNFSIFGQTGMIDHIVNHQTSANSSDNLSIFSAHDNVSNTGRSDWSSGSGFGDSGSIFGDSSSGGSFGDSGGGLGSSVGDSFSDSGGGLGSSLGDSFSDNSSSLDDSSFDDCSSGGSFDSND